MKTPASTTRWLIALACGLLAPSAHAVTNVFFAPTQTATVVSSNANAVTLASGDYEFTSSVDGLWAPCAGCGITGRFFSVAWPNGIQAQAITAGPLFGKGANLTLRRADGQRFDLRAFTGKLLANTAATGAAFEVMPLLDGEDALNDPLMFNASGFGGQSFAHTPNLSGYDTYKFHLFVDWALTALVLVDPNSLPPPPTNRIAASVFPAGAGSVSGEGSYARNDLCTLAATANAGWTFQNWTENGTPVSASDLYAFTVSSHRSLVAVFVPAPTALTIEQIAPNTLQLTWPTSSVAFAVQWAETLAPTQWASLTNPVTLAGTNHSVTLEPLNRASFYRLYRP